MPKAIAFADFPDFRPNLTPREIFELGSFGGTYWRPIRSAITKKAHRGRHRRFRQLARIPADMMTRPFDRYDPAINRYGVRVGTTLEYWESRAWITKRDPYGWVEWYCNFYEGRRSPDDEWQISRWLRTAGPSSRFRRRLINMVRAKRAKYSDVAVSPAIRQTLQHWAYQLTARDCR